MAQIPEVVAYPTPLFVSKKLYFDNNKVEDLMLRYRWTGCTDAGLRDKIMANTEELIRQIIRAHNLHRIYPGQEESAFMDLFQTAWVQIERTLYKYKARAHCGRCYNPARPMDSCLYNPGDYEYDIITPRDVLKLRLICPTCGTIPPKLIYRGTSKVFNMWCVRPDTMITTTDGINTINNVANRYGYDDKQEIWTLGINGDPRRVVAGVIKPETEILDIKTSLGYTIGCTGDHSLAYLSEHIGWRKAKDLIVGDLLAIQYNHGFFVNNDDISDIELSCNKSGCSGVTINDWSPSDNITSELAYIIGLYIAEGSCSDNAVTIYNTDDDIIHSLVNNNIGLKFIYHKDRQAIICSNKRFAALIRAINVGDSATTKHLSQRLLSMSKHNIAAMISGLFDGDGHSSRHNGCIGYTSTSYKLINQLRMLLLNFGILSKFSTDDRKSSSFNRRGKQYSSPRHPVYQLLLPTVDSMEFYKNVGFKVERKQQKQQFLSKPCRYLYGLNDRFRKLKLKYGCGEMGYNKIRTVIEIGKKRCELRTAIKLLENWKSYITDSDYIFIADRINEYTSNSVKTIWLPISSIIASTSPVCEISVDSLDNSYVANGFISHNSQVARTVILAYIKKESRDYKNSDAYKGHLDNKHNPTNDTLKRFLEEARQICKHNVHHMTILEALEHISEVDDRPYEGIIGKLVKLSGQSRAQVSGFLKILKLRSSEFTDSPINARQPFKFRSVAADPDE